MSDTAIQSRLFSGIVEFRKQRGKGYVHSLGEIRNLFSQDENKVRRDYEPKIQEYPQAAPVFEPGLFTLRERIVRGIVLRSE